VNDIGNLIWRVSSPPSHVEESGILYHADFRDIICDIPAESVDLIVTDPPYGINYRGCGLPSRRGSGGKQPRLRSSRNLIVNDEYSKALIVFDALLRRSSRVLKKGGCFCTCCPAGGRHARISATWLRLIGEYLSIKDVIVWDKIRPGLGGHYRKGYEFVLIGVKQGRACKWNGGTSTSNVIRCLPFNRQTSDHPTPKPEALMSHFVALHSNPGDLVLDPFAGHGTTLVAAKKLRRRYIGIELIDRYCAAAEHRLNVVQLGE